MTLRLQTFGAIYIDRNGVQLGGAHTQRRRLAFLAFIAASDRGVAARQKVIALLWPERDEAGGRHSLSQLLYALRQDLGAEVLRTDHETIALNPELLESDVRVFDEALRAGELERAIEVYHGPFLDDFHLDDAPDMERWIESERSRREGQCSRALEQLATDSESSGDWHRARELWHRRAVLDPADGRVMLRHMRALEAVGDRRGALRAAGEYERLVRNDLDTEPDQAVARFAEKLRHDPAPQAAFPLLSPALRVVTSPSATLVPLPVAAAIPAEGVVAHDEAAAYHPKTTNASVAAAPDRRRWRWIAGVASVAGAVALLIWLRPDGQGDASAAPGIGAIVVLGDLTGPDTVLALAVREALRARLSNTRGVVVTSDLRVRELESLMRLADSRLRPPQLLSVAMRAGAHVAITGSVLPIGTGAQIVIDVLDPRSGKVERTFSERPLDARSILTSAESMGRSLAALISRSPRDSSVRALPAVTTASLPALKNYALARNLAARGRRSEALEYGERAVVHDSTFVLAHYLLADLLWFLDEQGHSDAHLTKAYELSGTVPAREQLVIRARYEQLVRDRPDTALVYWDLLRDTSPGDVLAYEGRTWALRALGRHEEAAAAADTAMRLEPAAVVPNINNAMYSWLAVGDTASALAVARRVGSRNSEALPEALFYAALQRGDLNAALALADSSALLSSRAWRRQQALLARGDVAGARINLDSLSVADQAQFKPRALLVEGWAELALNGDRGAARHYARETLAWLGKRDLSPPAIARLAERTGDLAARAGDEETVLAVIKLVRQRDRRRSLRSYVLAERTLDAALAYVRGDFSLAARRAQQARHGVYFWRSLITIVQLEADARASAGEQAVADSLNRLIATHQIVDGDFETWGVLRASRARRTVAR